MKKNQNALPFKKNDIVELIITAMSSDGEGIAKKDGFVIFVENGVEGDICECRILKCLAHRAYAKIERIIQPSDRRIESDCAAFYKCGGCRFRNISYQAELEFKLKLVNDALERIAGSTLRCKEVVPADSTMRYRNKALIPVGEDRAGRPTFGFYRKNSHDIIQSDDCLIQKSEAYACARAVCEYMSRTGECAYNEQTGEGAIRRIFVRSSEYEDSLLVVIVSAKRRLKDADMLIELIKQTSAKVGGIMLNLNKSRGNAALGDQNILLYGRDYIEDRLCGVRFRISPQSFFQINPKQAQKLYDLAISMAGIDKSTEVLDLYCGAGTITLCMAGAARSVTGVEIVPEAIENALQNARLNGIDNAEFICAPADEAAQRLAARGYRPDVITVDPPRKGLDAGTIEAIETMRPQRLVYISCNPSTMARDIKILEQKGFEPRKVCAVDMFPRTSHVETVVLLSEASSRSKK